MDKFNLIYKYTMGIILLAFLGVVIFLNLITPAKAFSETENRRLEQAPKFSFNELFHGKFTSNFEKYIADQFVYRDFWIGIKSDSERVMGKNESNGVYAGKDGYLIQTFNKPTDKSFNKKMESINAFAASTPNVNKYFMLVPNSVKIYEDKLPSYASVDDELSYINKTKVSIDKSIKFVDVYNTLNSKKDEYIFYKTDHHWTTKAAFYAYNELTKYMNIKPHEESYFTVKKVTDDFLGSLYSKGGFRHISPDSIELYTSIKDEGCNVQYMDEHKNTNSIYDLDNLNKKDKYTVFLDGNHPLIKISTNVSNGKKLLIVKDSYANCLIPFLVGHYSELYVVDLRYYSESFKDLIVKNDIKDMLMLYNVNTFFEDETINSISE